MSQRVAAYQQPEVLLHQLQIAGVTHGHDGTVTLEGVRVDGPVAAELFFCPMTGVALQTTNQVGDGTALHREVVLADGFTVPTAPGYYDVTVHVHANSRTTLSAAKWKPRQTRNREPELVVSASAERPGGRRERLAFEEDLRRERIRIPG